MNELPAPPPSDQVERLVPADVRDGRTDRGPNAARAWDGVVWSRLGRGDLAFACWDAVADPELQPWLHAERGRVVRELGLHARAEEHDLAGLKRAVDPVDEAMLWIGLTADAVGLGEIDEALLRLAGARDAVDSAPDGPRRDRQVLRLTWVETEVAGLTGEEPPAGPWPVHRGGAVAWPREFDAATDFHRAKAALFRGAVTGDRALLELASSLAPPALLWAVELALADAGGAGALDRARRAWAELHLPPGVRSEVARTPVAVRLGGPPGAAAD